MIQYLISLLQRTSTLVASLMRRMLLWVVSLYMSMMVCLIEVLPHVETFAIGLVSHRHKPTVTGTCFIQVHYPICMCTLNWFWPGFTYFASQNGGSCSCGDDGYDKHGAAPEPECNMPCATDSSETCGAAWRNSVYKTGGLLCCKLLPYRRYTFQTFNTERPPPVL